MITYIRTGHRQHSAIFTCDRCGKSERVQYGTAETVEQPIGWCYVRRAGQSQTDVSPIYCSETCAEQAREPVTINVSGDVNFGPLPAYDGLSFESFDAERFAEAINTRQLRV